MTSRNARSKSVLAACVLMFVQTSNVFGRQNAADQTALIQALMARIDQLERRVVQLEGANPAVNNPPQVPAPTEAMPMVSQGLGGGEAHPALDIGGFSDFTFSATDQAGAKSGFSEGQFILHLNSHLSSKVTFMGELSLTARGDAGTGSPPATGFNGEVERSIIRFEHNDYFKISFGRYHTPVNYWNTAFHHGQWLQTTVARPEMTQFGGKFIPVHFVGALVEGPAAEGRLRDGPARRPCGRHA